ncbi:DUF4194 domain-containing protein [Leucobacter celer]|uniref:DUF4194 domain-containing protein n=1 Tax=Leucobacter celer TaxID=668625 RepID=UPI0006A767D9|nr:DUF4194 domain-containing protein [Leucobacter celer]
MTSPEEHAIATAIVKLMQGTVYRETHEDIWRTLERYEAPVQDHFARIGVRVIVDPLEGYAFLKTTDPGPDEDPLPRLVKRRALTYPVSLLLLLLRKRLAEFEAAGGEGKLVLEREQIVEMLRLFLADSTNEARVLQQVDQTISAVAKLGFMRELGRQRASGTWEVRRILKAYVDAETMSDFAGKLSEYANGKEAEGDGDDD